MTTTFKRLLVLFAVFGLLAAACGNDDDSRDPDDPISIEAVFYTDIIPWMQEVQQGMNERAAELGVNLSISSANFDVAEQVDLIDNAIVKQPDAIAVGPLDRVALIPPIERAAEEGIPVVTFGDELAEEGKELELTYLGQFYSDMGVLKAEYIAEQLGGQGTVMVIHGNRGSDFIEAQREGLEEVFAEYPGITLVGNDQYGQISSDSGLELTENLLTAHGTPDAIFFDNDDIALGGLQALEEQNIDPSTIVTVSSDGTVPALNAIREGHLDYIVGSRPNLIGAATVQVLYDYVVNDIEPEEAIIIPFIEITSANVDDLEDADIVDPS